MPKSDVGRAFAVLFAVEYQSKRYAGFGFDDRRAVPAFHFDHRFLHIAVDARTIRFARREEEPDDARGDRYGCNKRNRHMHMGSLSLIP